MSQYQFISDYKDQDDLRGSFNELAKNTFGLDFEKWYQDGYWNENYICYSYTDNSRVISNISVHPMNLMINGEPKKAIQIGTVMTHPDYRKRGLARKLMEHIIAKYENECDLFYLSANETVMEFYPKFGFELKTENEFILPVQGTKEEVESARKLDLSKQDDLNVLLRLTENRKPVSKSLDTFNDEHIVRFYTTNFFNDNLYYIEEEDAIAVFNRDKDTLHLLGVISNSSVDLRAVVNHIITKDVKQVEFHFTPDLNDDKLIINEFKDMDRFIRPGSFELPKHLVFPQISQG